MFKNISHREMQIRTTKKFQYIDIRMAHFFFNGNNKSQQWCGETETVIYCWSKFKIVAQPFIKQFGSFLWS